MVTSMCIPELVLPVSSFVLLFAIHRKLCVSPPETVCRGWGHRFLIYGHSAFLSFIAAHVWLKCKSVLCSETLIFLVVLYVYFCYCCFVSNLLSLQQKKKYGAKGLTDINVQSEWEKIYALLQLLPAFLSIFQCQMKMPRQFCQRWSFQTCFFMCFIKIPDLMQEVASSVIIDNNWMNQHEKMLHWTWAAT